MKLLLLILLFILSMYSPASVARTNIDAIKTAYTEFVQLYTRLPRGTCSSNSMQPYMNALNALVRFETLAEPLENKPYLGEHKNALQRIIDTSNACETAGISFRCANGPCGGGSRNYIEPVALPEAFFGSNRNLSISSTTIEMAWVNNHPAQRFQRLDGNLWAEYNAENRRAFTFSQYSSDEWSVYLYDESRNVYVAIDLHRMMTKYKVGNNQWVDLYPITEIH